MTASVTVDRRADAGDPAVLAELLTSRLGTVLDADVAIANLRRLTGGASRETWAFEAVVAGESRRLVLRRDPPGPGRPEGMAREAAAIAAAEQAGVPVPHLVDHGVDPAVVGAPYLITEHVDGETIARRLLREPQFAQAREGMAAELGRALARIHSVPVAAIPGAETYDPLERLRENYDALGEPLPSIEIALAWLERNRPEQVADTVVHGDFRNGNLIIAPDGLAAVLDWEVVHRGDPREDLGWLCVKCWRFGAEPAVGGFGTVEQLLDGYAEVAGWRPDAEAVRWWQVYGTARWAVGCRFMAERHLSGETPSVELVAIGRRVCEQEHDLFLALGIPAEAPVLAEAPRSDLHGRPTSRDLLGAVAMYLREDVMTGTEGRLQFNARVAANVVDGVARELAYGADQERRHAERLARFGQADQRALADAIRSGVVAPDDPDLLAAVRTAITDRVAVANPKYLTHPG